MFWKNFESIDIFLSGVFMLLQNLPICQIDQFYRIRKPLPMLVAKSQIYHYTFQILKVTEWSIYEIS